MIVIEIEIAILTPLTTIGSNIVNGRFPLADLPEKLPPPELYHLPICESQSNEVSRPYTRKSGTRTSCIRACRPSIH